jgi:transketolase
MELIADMCRANTLASVKRAGSGHLGSSFSSLDIVTWLYLQEMNTCKVGWDDPNRDIYFSSKGHDVPGLYAVLYTLGVLPPEQFMRLRRLGGTYGHPDVSIKGIEANSGSLGMGISKGKGMAFAKRLGQYQGQVYVMTGDGELQEGQIYEGLQTAANQNITNLTVIVDHNKVQSDRLVHDISDLGNLEKKFAAFGWYVCRCNGHDFYALEQAFAEMKKINDRPKILIADTIKGRGVSFMEHPQALESGKGFYRWHSGAPDDVSFAQGYKELIDRINKHFSDHKLGSVKLELVAPEPKITSGVSNEYISTAFGDALLEVAAKEPNLVVLDADLSGDCHLLEFEKRYPERFIENGIAEQDMVSMAGGLALQGFLPVVNTFSAFLAARANEQIYTNFCEGTRIIYACHYSGLIPAGPGQSHQSTRDISLLATLPNFEIIQPCNSGEMRQAVEYCVEKSSANCVLRLNIGPSPRIITLPPDYSLTPGQGVELSEGADAVLFAYGPVMLHEALLASEILSVDSIGLQVINMPWLNKVDLGWLSEKNSGFSRVFVLEDHSPTGGLGDFLLNSINESGLSQQVRLTKFAPEGRLACGTPAEVLKFHGLDGKSLADRVKKQLQGK